MAKKSNTQNKRHQVIVRKRDGIPNWLYMTLSFVIPLYGLLYYLFLKDNDNSRAKIALFFATVGFMIYLLLRVIVWLK